jgi:hypothetical protein
MDDLEVGGVVPAAVGSPNLVIEVQPFVRQQRPVAERAGCADRPVNHRCADLAPAAGRAEVPADSHSLPLQGALGEPTHGRPHSMQGARLMPRVPESGREPDRPRLRVRRGGCANNSHAELSMLDTRLVLEHGHERRWHAQDCLVLALSFLAKPLDFGLRVDVRPDNLLVGEDQVIIELRF